MPTVCPICSQPVASDASSRPFCTPRCKWVDLGRWFDGTYAIASEDPEALSAIEAYELEREEGDDA